MRLILFSILLSLSLCVTSKATDNLLVEVGDGYSSSKEETSGVDSTKLVQNLCLEEDPNQKKRRKCCCTRTEVLTTSGKAAVMIVSGGVAFFAVGSSSAAFLEYLGDLVGIDDGMGSVLFNTGFYLVTLPTAWKGAHSSVHHVVDKAKRLFRWTKSCAASIYQWYSGGSLQEESPQQSSTGWQLFKIGMTQFGTLLEGITEGVFIANIERDFAGWEEAFAGSYGAHQAMQFAQDAERQTEKLGHCYRTEPSAARERLLALLRVLEKKGFEVSPEALDKLPTQILQKLSRQYVGETDSSSSPSQDETNLEDSDSSLQDEIAADLDRLQYVSSLEQIRQFFGNGIQLSAGLVNVFVKSYLLNRLFFSDWSQPSARLFTWPGLSALDVAIACTYVSLNRMPLLWDHMEEYLTTWSSAYRRLLRQSGHVRSFSSTINFGFDEADHPKTRLFIDLSSLVVVGPLLAGGKMGLAFKLAPYVFGGSVFDVFFLSCYSLSVLAEETNRSRRALDELFNDFLKTYAAATPAVERANYLQTIHAKRMWIAGLPNQHAVILENKLGLDRIHPRDQDLAGDNQSFVRYLKYYVEREPLIENECLRSALITSLKMGCFAGGAYITQSYVALLTRGLGILFHLPIAPGRETMTWEDITIMCIVQPTMTFHSSALLYRFGTRIFDDFMRLKRSWGDFSQRERVQVIFSKFISVLPASIAAIIHFNLLFDSEAGQYDWFTQVFGAGVLGIGLEAFLTTQKNVYPLGALLFAERDTLHKMQKIKLYLQRMQEEEDIQQLSFANDEISPLLDDGESADANPKTHGSDLRKDFSQVIDNGFTFMAIPASIQLSRSSMLEITSPGVSNSFGILGGGLLVLGASGVIEREINTILHLWSPKNNANCVKGRRFLGGLSTVLAAFHALPILPKLQELFPTQPMRVLVTIALADLVRRQASHAGYFDDSYNAWLDGIQRCSCKKSSCCAKCGTSSSLKRDDMKKLIQTIRGDINSWPEAIVKQIPMDMDFDDFKKLVLQSLFKKT
ncbi:MAG: hypothetical protein ABFQ95_07445 [Pseudomonadota bacterium]